MGEKRVKPLLFQGSKPFSFFILTVFAIFGLMTLDWINEMGCEQQHHNSKLASLDDAEKAAKLLQDEAQERYTNYLQQTENQEENKAITTAYIEEDKEITKQLYATSDKIHATERTTQSFLRGLMRSESSRQVIGAVERIGASVFEYWGGDKKK